MLTETGVLRIKTDTEFEDQNSSHPNYHRHHPLKTGKKHPQSLICLHYDALPKVFYGKPLLCKERAAMEFCRTTTLDSDRQSVWLPAPKFGNIIASRTEHCSVDSQYPYRHSSLWLWFSRASRCYYRCHYLLNPCMSGVLWVTCNCNCNELNLTRIRINCVWWNHELTLRCTADSWL